MLQQNQLTSTGLYVRFFFLMHDAYSYLKKKFSGWEPLANLVKGNFGVIADMGNYGEGVITGRAVTGIP